MAGKPRQRFDDAHYAARYPDTPVIVSRAVAEEDVRVAAEALAGGDVVTALRALGGPLIVDPFAPDWLALLDRALEEGVRAAVELDAHAEPWLGREAIRAYAAAADGDLKSALEQLRGLAVDRPRARFLEAWAPGWLASDGAIEGLDVELVDDVLYALANRFPDPPGVAKDAPAILGAALVLVDRRERAHGSDDATAIVRGMMLARAGRVDEAIRVTVACAERASTTMTLTAAAQAHRRAGDVDGAIPWFERAAAHEPTYPNCLLDLGDMCVDDGRWERALAAYDEALRRRPGHDWALPSAEYARYRMKGEPAALEALRGMANGAVCTCGGASALTALTGGYGYDDRQARAEQLIRRIEPAFVRRPREIVH